MDKEKAKQYLIYLNDRYTDWYTNPKERTKIATEIYNVAMGWDDEIYNYLSPGNAKGLFEHGFFESDIHRALNLLREIVNAGKPKPENKLYKLYTILQNYQAPQNEVVKKELKDYLLEKIHNGELKNRKITFKNDEDFEYFSKLANNIGFDVNAILEDIIMQTFDN